MMGGPMMGGAGMFSWPSLVKPRRGRPDTSNRSAGTYSKPLTNRDKAA